MEKIRYILALSLLFVFSITFGQVDLSLSKIVPLEGYSADVLLHNADAYFTSKTTGRKKKKKLYPDLIRDENSVSVNRETMVYSRSIAKHPLGKLTYIYKIEVKDNKYRYTLAGMEYIPFERNRYGKFVPVPGKQYSIDYILGNENFRYRKNILAYIDSYIEQEAVYLHNGMSQDSFAENAKKKKDQDDW